MWNTRKMSFIDELATEKRRLILKKGVSTLPVRNKPVVSLSDTLKSEGLSFICEVKRASPSEGKIADFDAKELAGTYEQSGASAISVLTEEKHFKGSLADL
ncbi:MAG: indole-3-glycerol-phosphate synthase TrpC, partial [Candidatus Altiarchaeota archaeon]|nr:indole-3-glycerol-phosphate synthase TrpC [Candidatus Altiarchaeota archaeon]